MNTVETQHLRHIYAKLGVQSRLQLATHLAAKPDGEELADNV